MRITLLRAAVFFVITGRIYTFGDGQPTHTVEQREDLVSKIEKASDVAESKIDEYANQLEKIMDVLARKYKKIKPKIQKIKTILKQWNFQKVKIKLS